MKKDYGKNSQCLICGELFNYLGLARHRSACRELKDLDTKIADAIARGWTTEEAYNWSKRKKNRYVSYILIHGTGDVSFF